jgi:hypothetical protein
MSPSRTDDYILRQIQVVGQMLARAIGLRVQGQQEEARAELEQCLELLLGPQAMLVRTLDVGTAAACLNAPEMIVAYAQLVAEEAAQERDDDRRAGLRARAVALAETALRQYPDDEDLARAVREISSH